MRTAELAARASPAAVGVELSLLLAPPSLTHHVVTAPFLHFVYFAGALPSYPHRCLTPRLLGVSLARGKNYHSVQHLDATDAAFLMKGLCGVISPERAVACEPETFDVDALTLNKLRVCNAIHHVYALVSFDGFPLKMLR